MPRNSISERLHVTNDNLVLITVDLMNLNNDISRFLVLEKPEDMTARRTLALNMRLMASELELAS